MAAIYRADSATPISAAAGSARTYNKFPLEIQRFARILIVAPHPDDEVIAAGGLIAAALASGKQCSIRVIIATNGDAAYMAAPWHGSHLLTRRNFRQQALIRQHESLNALSILGLDVERVHFWGFPDRGLARLWVRRQQMKRPYRSRTTGYDRCAQALNSPVLSYTAYSLSELFSNELAEFSPTTIILPHPQDRHPDHKALSLFTLDSVARAFAKSDRTPELYAYWMWRQHKPWLMGRPLRDVADALIASESPSFQERCFELSPDIRAHKVRALKCFSSQRRSAGKLIRDSAQKRLEEFTELHLSLKK